MAAPDTGLDAARLEWQTATDELRRQRDEARHAQTLAEAELEAWRGREAGMAAVLRVFSRTPADQQRVFDAILENAARACGADSAELVLVDAESVRVAAGFNHGITHKHISPLSDRNIAGRAILGRQTIQWCGGALAFQQAFPESDPLLLAGDQCALATPLIRANEGIGALTVQRSGSAQFNDDQIAWLETYADQAVIVIEHARTLQNLSQARKQQTVLGEILRIISSSPGDRQRALDAVSESAARLCGARIAQIVLLEGEAIRYVSGYNIPEDLVLGQSFPLSRQRATGRAIIDNQTMHVWGGQEAIQKLFPDSQTIREGGPRSMVASPLRRDGRPIGAIAITREDPRPFTDQQIELIKTFADQGVVVIENTRLFEEIQQKRRELETVNHQLAEANHHKSAFLANMSHELRTPLNAIIGYSEMLAEACEDLGAENLVPDLVKINAAGRHLLSLISNILDLSKIEAGKMDLYLEEFEIATLLHDVEAVVQPLVAKNDNVLQISTGADLGCMRADLTKLRQSLFNVISNAAKFTEQGTITLDARRESKDGGESILFAVSDTGIGMTESQLGKLFQAFSQAEAGTSRKYGGTGLGLALSRSFCQMMGGEITVRSIPGRGSTFTILLPARANEAR